MPLLFGDVARSRVLTPVGRVVSSLRVRGLAPTLVSVCDALRRSLWLHETHVWSSLDLRTERPHLPLPAPFSWTLGTDDDIPRLGVLGIDVEGARRRRAAGHDVWLIRDGDLLVYAGWVFHRVAPTAAARTGWVELLPGTSNPEDMVTDPAYRGRGLASSAYTLIFDALLESGRAERIVGKVPVDNGANRRALMKSGWREFARVEVRRVGPWRRARVDVVPAGEGRADDAEELTRWLRAALERRPAAA